MPIPFVPDAALSSALRLPLDTRRSCFLLFSLVSFLTLLSWDSRPDASEIYGVSVKELPWT